MTFKEKCFNLVNKDEKIFQNLEIYVKLIEEKNKLFNLTGFTGELLWRDGIYQSILLMDKSFDNIQEKNMLDIGAGVGFPSIPFLIYKRNFSLFISEPSKKRVEFLELVKEKLSLNITFINTRIEDYSETIKFDLITARAVTSLKNLIEISSKVGSLNAQYSFLKGPKIYEELTDSKWIIDKLAISPSIHKVNVKINEETSQTHYLFKYIKFIQTPSGFPRSWLSINIK